MMTLSIKLILVVLIIMNMHLRAFSQDTSAVDLYNYGVELVQSKPDEAIILLEKSLKLALDSKNFELYLKSANQLGKIRYVGKEKQKDQVFGWLKEAIEIVKDSKKTADLAELHYNLARFYSDLSQEIDLPLHHFEKAKAIWIELNGEENEHVAACYHGLADIYKYSKFDFHEAEKCYEKALLIRDKIAFQDPKVLYNNYYGLAATNRSQYDFEKALSYGEKALEIANKVGPLRVELANGLMANIYRDMKQPARAIEYYLNALAVNKTTQDLSARASYYLNLGQTYKNDSLLTDALSYFEKAYQLYRKPEVRDERLFLILLINIIDTYSLAQTVQKFSTANKEGRLSNERKFHRFVKEASRELDALDRIASREAAEVWLAVGDHHYRQKNYDSSLFYYQKALVTSIPSFKSTNIKNNPSEEMVGFQYIVAEIEIQKAIALRAKFRAVGKNELLYESLNCLKLVESLLSKQRNTLDSEASKWGFLESNFDRYEDILSTLFQGKETLSKDTINKYAVQYFERSKARSLADALVRDERNKKISNEDSLFRVHTELQRQLFSVQELVSRAEEIPDNAQQISTHRQSIAELDQRIQECKIAIEEKYPGYFNVKYGYENPNISEIQTSMKKSGRVLLEFFWGNKDVYGIGINDKAVLFKRIGSPGQINTLVKNLQGHFKEGNSPMSQQRFQSFTTNAHELFKILILPFDSLLSDNRRILVVPDGAISQVPFEILLSEDSKSETVNYKQLQYLLKSFTIGYAYSYATLDRKLSKRITNPSLLAIGFSVGKNLLRAGPQLEEIEGSKKELESLEKYFENGKFLLGTQATESNFKKLAPQFDILHLAIHGMGDTKRNFAASLYFRPTDDDLEDGELHAYELYGLKLKAMMTVLTACESGLGQGYKGEGMISIASAFTYSGCENILMSLWKVSDQAASSLMDNFYKHLSKGETIDESLRISKLDYLQTADELTADPKVWGPMVAYGSLEPIYQNNRKPTIIFIASAIFIMALVLVLRKKF